MELSTKRVEDFVGRKNKSGYVDGPGDSAEFFYPMGLVGIGTDLYVADNGNCKIRKIDTLTKMVTTIAGGNRPCPIDVSEYGEDNTVGNNARLEGVVSLTTDGSFIYFGGEFSVIRKVSLTGTNAVETVVVDVSIENVIDIVYTNETLYYVNFYESSKTNIYKVDLKISNPPPVPFAGGTTSGMADGIGAAARFRIISGIETDGTNLYVSDSKNLRLRQIDLVTAEVTTLAGSATLGNFDALGTSARLNRPGGIFFKDGLLYFTCLGSHNIRTYNLASTLVSTIAGNNKE